MAKCDMCGNDYDKTFTIRRDGRNTPSTASNAPFTCSRRNARIASAASSGTGSKRAALCIAAPIAQRKAGRASSEIASEPCQRRKKANSKRWSAEVTAQSDALSLEENVFKKRSARQIALSLKRSAEKSKRRKATPLQSAMSMLNFYINRAGTNLSASRQAHAERRRRSGAARLHR